MRQCGCRLIHFGIESGSQRILNLMNKKTTQRSIQKAVDSAHKAGMQTACFFLLGFPGESPQEMRDTLKLARSLNPTYASFHIVTPYPETSLYESALSQDRFPRYCRTGLNPDDLEKFVRHAFLSYYIRPGYLIGHIFRGSPRLWRKHLDLLLEFIK